MRWASTLLMGARVQSWSTRALHKKEICGLLIGSRRALENEFLDKLIDEAESCFGVAVVLGCHNSTIASKGIPGTYWFRKKFELDLQGC
eukprot:IDg4845t1